MKKGKEVTRKDEVDGWIADLQSSDSHRLISAIQALSQLRDEQTIQRLVQLVGGDDSELMSMRNSVRQILSQIGSPSVPFLAQRLCDGQDDVSWTLICIGTPVTRYMMWLLHGNNSFARYHAQGIIDAVVSRQKREAKRWQESVWADNFSRISYYRIPISTRWRLLQEVRNRDYYLQNRSHPLVTKAYKAGLLETETKVFIRNLFLPGYYACRVCGRDDRLLEPVKCLVAVIDDVGSAKDKLVLVNGVAYVPWSPPKGIFDFDMVEIRQLDYPQSGTIETLVHFLEKDKDPGRPWKQTSGRKIPCRLAPNVQLSAADFSRLSPYFAISPLPST